MRQSLKARARDIAPPGAWRLAAKLADEARFLKAWIAGPSVTGSVAPSSRMLARAVAEHVDPSAPGPVIELGAGTGPVTEALLARGIEERRLILVEFDPKFCALLTRRFPAAAILRGDAYDLPGTLAALPPISPSAIVSGLPLLLREPAVRAKLLADAFALLAPGAPFIQFTYGLQSPMPPGAVAALGASMSRSRPIWLNLPPAYVWVYRQAEAREPPPPSVALMDRLRQPAR